MSEKEYIFVGNAQLKTRDYIKQLEKDNREKDKEIERLNNIINEIRKWLEEDYKRTIDNEVCDYPRYYLDKFDEIVGSDKE